MAKDAELPAGFEDLRGREFQGRYALDELLYASPRRVSFAGRARDTERGIVLELVRPARLHEQATVERFEQRIAACKRVRHPVIHGPIDAGELVDGKLWVVSERPAGEPLDRHLQRHPPGRLGWMDARPLLLELVRGLATTHARRVVHGSLSPGCCWIDRPDFGVPSLRVLGFGVNTSPPAGDEQLAHSRTTVLGHDTLFMAPETAGGVFGDERSDVYLTGLVAWFMLVGRPPFQATNPFQLAAMHLTAPVPAMRDAGAEVPASVDELVRSMLAKNAQQRIGGMVEIEQVLLGLDEGGEARDVRPSLEPQAARGRRGRARARHAGASSREEAVQRLSEKDGVGGGRGYGAVPRLPRQEIEDAHRGAAPRQAPARLQQPVEPAVDSHLREMPPPISPHPPRMPPMPPAPQNVPPTMHPPPQRMALPVPPPPQSVPPAIHSPPQNVSPPSLSLPTTVARAGSPPHAGRAYVEVEATQHLDRFAPVAAAPPAGEHTVMLSSREISEQLWSGQGHDPDEAKPDATMMLLVPESAAPPSRAPSKAARFVQEQLGTLRSGSAPLAGPIHDPAPPVVPVVTGRTERMSPEEVRMLRLAGLGGNVSASPSPVRTPEPVVEATQVLEVVEDADLEERQTTTFSPEQVRAFRRAYEADPGPGEGR